MDIETTASPARDRGTDSHRHPDPDTAPATAPPARPSSADEPVTPADAGTPGSAAAPVRAATNRGKSRPGAARRPAAASAADATPRTGEQPTATQGARPVLHLVRTPGIAPLRAGPAGHLDVVASMSATDRLVQQLTRQARAHGTRESYASHFQSFDSWCAGQGVRSLPANPEDVLAHLALMSVATDDEGQPVVTADGEYLRGLHVSSVEVRMYAIDYHHKQAGYAAPSSDPRVRTLMQGIRRRFGVAPDEQRAPLGLEDLKCLETAARTPLLSEVLRVAVPALADATGATPGQLQRLDWHHIDVTDSAAVLRLTRPDVGYGHIEVRITATGAATCPVALLHLLACLTGTDGPVLLNTSGDRLSVQWVRTLTKTRRDGVGLMPGATQLRDAVLCLVGWWSALRRDNLSEMRWSHLLWERADTEGIVVQVLRSKTDQEGRGRSVGLLRADDAPNLCPVRALQQWRAFLTETLGQDPMLIADLPVLLAVDAHGVLRLPRPGKVGMTGTAINDRVQMLADRAGLTEQARALGYGKVRHPYGAHSMRAGYITALLASGGSLHDGARHLGHAKLDTARDYERRLALTGCPSRQLLQALGDVTT